MLTLVYLRTFDRYGNKNTWHTFTRFRAKDYNFDKIKTNSRSTEHQREKEQENMKNEDLPSVLH